MAKIKNVSGEDRLVPGLGGRLVLAGAVVEVPDEDAFSYTCQEANWSPADKAAQKAHDAAAPSPEPAAAPEPTKEG